MTDRAQFEAMLEALINDDQEQAKAIFHNIVVGKSREIYEELLAEDFSQDQGNPYGANEGMEEEEESVEEDMEEEGAEESADDSEDDSEEADDSEEDSEDDAEDDGEEGEENPFGDEEGGEEEGEEGELEDRVMDLEDALEDLKAEFEQLMAGEEAEEHDHPGIHDMGGDDLGAEMGGDEMEMEMDDPSMVMEYVNKVASPKGGDNGVNTKSAVAGKNDMGGTTANIAKSFSTTTGGTQGGLLKPTTGDLASGLGTIQNRPDSKAGKTAFKKSEPGHGAEKAGKKETADNKQSVLKAVKK